MPVIPVNIAVDPKKNFWKKMEGRGGGKAQGVADPKKNCQKKTFLAILIYIKIKIQKDF
jgi:hypothetical protein